MIDLSNLKSPGWAKVVQELAGAAPDDRSFLERLLAVITQVSTARQGVLHMVERGEGDEPEPRPSAVWPPQASTSGPQDPNDGHIAQAVEMSADQQAFGRAMSGRWVVGDAEQARRQVLDLAATYGVDEVMVHPVAGAHAGTDAQSSPNRETTLRLLAG